jgi:hypothetical protein
LTRIQRLGKIQFLPLASGFWFLVSPTQSFTQ